MSSILQDPLSWVAGLPPFALPLLVLVSALLEYVFPPYPGDGLVLLGFFLAGRGLVAVEIVFLAALVGSGLGAAIAFQLGRRYGRTLVDRVSQRLVRRGRFFIRLRPWIESHGEKALALNRFFPVLRGVLLYGAGAGSLRFLPAILWASVSNLIFLSLLALIGRQASASWEQIQGTFLSWNRGISVAAIFLTLLLLVIGWRLWQRPTATE